MPRLKLLAPVHSVPPLEDSASVAGEPSCRLTFSVPGVVERAEDYFEDLAQLLGDRLVHCSARCAWLTVELRCDRNSPGKSLRQSIEDIRRGLPAAVLIAASPDVVTLEEAARRVGVPVSCLAELRETTMFPLPFHPEYWRLVDLLRWVTAVGAVAVDPVLTAFAAATAQLNDETCHRRADLFAVA